jgi:hypothetical protein
MSRSSSLLSSSSTTTITTANTKVTIIVSPGVVCGGSVTLSETGGYPNSLPPSPHPSITTAFMHQLQFPLSRCILRHLLKQRSRFSCPLQFADFFGWGYEDHELLWRVEAGGEEASRRHWEDDRFELSSFRF